METGTAYQPPPFIPKTREYEDRFLAFVDILGFRHLVSRTAECDDTQLRIIDALTRIFISQPTDWGVTSDGRYVDLKWLH